MDSKLLRADFRTLSGHENVAINKTNVFDTMIAAVYDIVMAPQTNLNIRSEYDVAFLLLPIFGAVDVDEDQEQVVGINNVMLVPKNKGEIVKLTNPYEQLSVQVLIFEIPGLSDKYFNAFEIAKNNQLIQVFSNIAMRLTIGIFDARFDYTFERKIKKSKIFAFVVAGAFEFQGRLLEQRDAYITEEQTVMEFEALSDNAILLVFERML